jgi:thiol-disulfide isomerase/thioredoxin
VVRRALLISSLCSAVVAVAIAGFVVRGRADPVQRVNRPLPELRGASVVDGSPLSSSDFAGKVLVVNVWATNCTFCLQEIPMLVQTFHRYEDRGVAFLGIDHLEPDRAKARSWIEDRYRMPYPSILDLEGRFAGVLGYPFLPDTYVVDRSGTIRYQVFGTITEDELTGILDELLAAGEVSAAP